MMALDHLLCLMLSILQSPANIAMIPEKAELVHGERSLSPSHVSQLDRHTFSIGDLRISFDGLVLTARLGHSPEPEWTAFLTEGNVKRILSTGQRALYLCEVTLPTYLLQVDLDDGTITRTDTSHFHSFLPANRVPLLQGAIEVDDGVVLLTAIVNKDDARNPLISAWQVARFQAGRDSPLWTRELAVGGTPPPRFEHNYRLQQPLEAAGPSGLVPIGTHVVVAPGPHEDIVILDGSTGNTRAALNRVWEYERGFVGPSVWSNYLMRFGLTGPAAGDKGQTSHLNEVAKLRGEFNQRFRGAVVGGPIVVSPDRIFLAAELAPAIKDYAGLLAEVRVYELDGNLEPLGVAPLPFATLGSLAKVQSNALVWACEGTRLLRLQCSAQDAGCGMSLPGAYDARVDVRWLKRIARDPAGFLRTQPAWPWPVFGSDAAVVSLGGRMESQDDGFFRFPIIRVDLTNANEQTFELRVPFKGLLAPPTDNYRAGPTYYEVLGSYGIALTFLELSGSVLACTLWDGRITARLEFNLESLLAASR